MGRHHQVFPIGQGLRKKTTSHVAFGFGGIGPWVEDAFGLSVIGADMKTFFEIILFLCKALDG